MKWLVQEFLNNNSNMLRVIQALEICHVDYLLIRVNKDFTLTVLDKEIKTPLENSDSIIEKFIRNEDIMVYGSKMFATIAKEMDLKPGSFMNKNFEFEVFREILGEELLNSQFSIGELLDLNPNEDNFFIRPTGNTKLFTGMTVSKEEFLKWKERERNDNSPYIGQSLMISPVKDIKSEYRFFIVNQQIVASSSYRVNGILNTSCKPSEEMVDYTQDMVDKFPISKAFVIDIAETKEGFKVIEYNNINTSGLYGCDELSFVRAINSLT